MREAKEGFGRHPWEMVAVVGLVATALGPILAMMLDRAFAVPGLLFTLLPLVLAGVVLTRNRWFIALVVVMGMLLLAAALRSPIVQVRLTHPTTGYFLVAWLQTLGPALAIIAGLGALVQDVLQQRLQSARPS